LLKHRQHSKGTVEGNSPLEWCQCNAFWNPPIILEQTPAAHKDQVTLCRCIVECVYVLPENGSNPETGCSISWIRGDDYKLNILLKSAELGQDRSQDRFIPGIPKAVVSADEDGSLFIFVHVRVWAFSKEVSPYSAIRIESPSFAWMMVQVI